MNFRERWILQYGFTSTKYTYFCMLPKRYLSINFNYWMCFKTQFVFLRQILYQVFKLRNETLSNCDLSIRICDWFFSVIFDHRLSTYHGSLFSTKMEWLDIYHNTNINIHIKFTKKKRSYNTEYCISSKCVVYVRLLEKDLSGVFWAFSHHWVVLTFRKYSKHEMKFYFLEIMSWIRLCVNILKNNIEKALTWANSSNTTSSISSSYILST